MSVSSANRSLLFMTIATFIATTIATSVFHIQNAVLSELIPKLAALGIFMFMAKRDGVSDIPSVLGFHKLPIPAIGLCFLYYIASYPAMGLVAIVNSIFTSRLTSLFGGSIVQPSLLESVICTAVLPVLYEEILLRGMVYQSHRKTGRIRTAVFLSALLFGLLHMNLWQLAYTFVAGIFLTLIVEASGSLWSSILIHFCYNMTAIVFSYLSNSEEGGSNTAFIIFMAIAAAVGIAFSVILLRWIRASVGRDDNAYEAKQPGERLVTPALIVFMALCILANAVSALAILYPSLFS